MLLWKKINRYSSVSNSTYIILISLDHTLIEIAGKKLGTLYLMTKVWQRQKNRATNAMVCISIQNEKYKCVFRMISEDIINRHQRLFIEINVKTFAYFVLSFHHQNIFWIWIWFNNFILPFICFTSRKDAFIPQKIIFSSLILNQSALDLVRKSESKGK